MLLNCLLLVLMPNEFATSITFCFPIIGKSSLPSAAHLSERITSLACIPCCETPAAAPLKRFLATIVSASAPQVPLGDLAVILQGPMLHALQHVPARPKLQCGFCLSNLSNIFSMPCSFSYSSISLIAGSGVFSITSFLVGNVFLYVAMASI